MPSTPQLQTPKTQVVQNRTSDAHIRKFHSDWLGLLATLEQWRSNKIMKNFLEASTHNTEWTNSQKSKKIICLLTTSIWTHHNPVDFTIQASYVIDKLGFRLALWSAIWTSFKMCHARDKIFYFFNHSSPSWFLKQIFGRCFVQLGWMQLYMLVFCQKHLVGTKPTKILTNFFCDISKTSSKCTSAYTIFLSALQFIIVLRFMSHALIQKFRTTKKHPVFWMK